MQEIVQVVHGIARGLEHASDRHNAHAIGRRLADAPQRALKGRGFRLGSIVQSVRRVAEQAGSAGLALPSAVALVMIVEAAIQETFEAEETQDLRAISRPAAGEVRAELRGGLQ